MGIQVVDKATTNENESGGLADEWEIPEGIDFMMATVMDVTEGLNPTYKEAKTCPDWPRWKEAIEAEWKALVDNGTWKLVEHPEGANIVGCKWVLRIKKNSVGGIEKYKAQLVACTSGNTNLALAVFSCLWESLIVFAKDWLHV